MARAREQVQLARVALAAGFPSGAVSDAYYAMLYAARAALSEEELNAKTHRGVWTLFRESFVESGRFDRQLFGEAQRALKLREGADYDARVVAAESAEVVVEQADRFVATVAELFPA